MWAKGGGGGEERRVQQDNQSPKKRLEVQEALQVKEGGLRSKRNRVERVNKLM